MRGECMEKWGKRISKLVMLCGAIASGLALNTVDAKAAETNAEELQSVENEQVEAEEASQTEETIESMRDATEVVEGDLVAEEGYLNQAQEAIDNDELTTEVAEEILNGGEDVLEQAREKEEYVEKKYEELQPVLESQTEVAEEELEKTASKYGFAECIDCIEKTDEVESNSEKLEIVEETIKAVNENYEEFTKERGLESSAYKEAVQKYNDAVAEKERLQKEQKEINAELGKIKGRYFELSEIVSDFESIEYEYINKIDTAKNSINDLKEKEKSIVEAKDACTQKYNELLAEYQLALDDPNASSEKQENSEKELNEYIPIYSDAVNKYEEHEKTLQEQQQNLDSYEKEYKEWRSGEYAEVHKEYSEVASKYWKYYSDADWVLEEIYEIGYYVGEYGYQKAMLEIDIETEAYRYNTKCEILNHYHDSIKNLVEIEQLKERAAKGLQQTESTYSSLKKLIEENNSIEKSVSQLNRTVIVLANTQAELETDYSTVNTCVEKIKKLSDKNEIDQTKIESIKSEAKTAVEAAQKKNEEAHNYYDEIQKKTEQIINQYNEASLSGEEVSEEISAAYQQALQLREQAQNLVDKADSSLEHAIRSNEELEKAIKVAEEKNKEEILPINANIEFKAPVGKTSYTVKISVTGNVKNVFNNKKSFSNGRDLISYALNCFSAVVNVNVSSNNVNVFSLSKKLGFLSV